MITAYVRDSDGYCDTERCGGVDDYIESCGSATPPGSDCDGHANDPAYYPVSTDCPIHVKRLSDCSIDTIANDTIGGWSSR